MSQQRLSATSSAQNWLRLDIDETARAQESETAIDPHLPIVDAHHHLWDGPVHRFDGYEFLEEASSGHRIVASVFIECSTMYRQTGPLALRSIGETEYVNGIAAMTESGTYGECRVAAGIVGYTDLCDQLAAESLDLHILRAGSRFKGVRYPVAWHPEPRFQHRRHKPSPHLLRQADFRRGFDELARRGLSFDAWIYYNQASELMEIADLYPETTIIVNHLAGPVGIGEANAQSDIVAAWKDAIESLASRPNLIMKIGGLGMPLFGFHSRLTDKVPVGKAMSSQDIADLWAPYAAFAIEAFGPDRCMFESNFPMDKELCSYNTLWNAFKRIAQPFPNEAKRWLFSRTAAKAYRLNWVLEP